MRPSTLSAALLAVFLLPADQAGAREFPVTIDSKAGTLRVSRVLDGLQIPWGIAFLPDGRALLSERPGRLSLVDIDAGAQQDIDGVPQVAALNQGGLLDVQVHPGFADTGLVYLCFSAPVEGGQSTRVARYRLDGERLVDEQVLFTAVPATKAVHHFGCRIQFDGKGHVYFSVGDRGERHQAQDLGNDAGKIHRLREDGSIPEDNPFVAQEGARPSIWSYGHRNPQGLAFAADGRLWSHEHGPRGGDEINLVRKAANYGWPVITFGREYHGPKIGEGSAREGMEQPALQWTPSIAPSGMAIYASDRIPGWRGQILSGAMALTHLNRVRIDGDRAEEVERVFDGRGWRIRDVEQDAQGRVYLLTDNGWLLQVDRAGD